MADIHFLVQYKEAILAYAILLKEEKGEVIFLSLSRPRFYMFTWGSSVLGSLEGNTELHLYIV